MTEYRLMDGVAGRPGVGSSGTQPPAAAVAFTGGYVAGLVFNVSETVWLDSFWWWPPLTNGNTAAQEFALYQATSSTTGALVPAATVTSGPLTAGQWNQVTLSAPVALSPFFPYVAATGFNSTSPKGFPDTVSQWGVGQPYAGGFSNGPLTALANGSALAFNLPQSPFGTGASDPTTLFPHTNNANDILWLDVQVTDQIPASQTYFELFPNSPGGFGSPQDLSYTLGVEFYVTQLCRLQRIRHWSPATSTVLPSRCGVWTIGTQTELAGSDNSSPAWIAESTGSAASPGAGWIYCDYGSNGPLLQPNVHYKVSTFANAGSSVWFAAAANWWGGGGLWSAGVTNGPLVVPGNAAATTPGQDSWLQSSTWGYPVTSTNPEYDGVSLRVAPVAASGSGLLMASYI